MQSHAPPSRGGRFRAQSEPLRASRGVARSVRPAARAVWARRVRRAARGARVPSAGRSLGRVPALCLAAPAPCREGRRNVLRVRVHVWGVGGRRVLGRGPRVRGRLRRGRGDRGQHHQQHRGRRWGFATTRHPGRAGGAAGLRDWAGDGLRARAGSAGVSQGVCMSRSRPLAAPPLCPLSAAPHSHKGQCSFWLASPRCRRPPFTPNAEPPTPQTPNPDPQEAKALGVFTQQQALEFMASKLAQRGPPRAFDQRRRKSKVRGAWAWLFRGTGGAARDPSCGAHDRSQLPPFRTPPAPALRTRLPPKPPNPLPQTSQTKQVKPPNPLPQTFHPPPTPHPNPPRSTRRATCWPTWCCATCRWRATTFQPSCSTPPSWCGPPPAALLARCGARGVSMEECVRMYAECVRDDVHLGWGAVYCWVGVSGGGGPGAGVWRGPGPMHTTRAGPRLRWLSSRGTHSDSRRGRRARGRRCRGRAAGRAAGLKGAGGAAGGAPRPGRGWRARGVRGCIVRARDRRDPDVRSLGPRHALAPACCTRAPLERPTPALRVCCTHSPALHSGAVMCSAACPAIPQPANPPSKTNRCAAWPRRCWTLRS
jgi:hypothetical protein